MGNYTRYRVNVCLLAAEDVPKEPTYDGRLRPHQLHFLERPVLFKFERHDPLDDRDQQVVDPLGLLVNLSYLQIENFLWLFQRGAQQSVVVYFLKVAVELVGFNCSLRKQVDQVAWM